MSERIVQQEVDESSPTGAPDAPVAPTDATVAGDGASADTSQPEHFTFFESLRKTTGKRSRKPWTQIFAHPRFTDPPVFAKKKEIPRWAPALFKDDERAKENVETVHALVLDYDAKLTRATVDGAVVLWGSRFGAIHTTWSSSVEVQSFRVILPFSRPVLPDVGMGRLPRKKVIGQVDHAGCTRARERFPS